MKKLIFLGVFAALFACSPQEEPILQDPELMIYVRSFATEAAERGISLDVSQVQIRFAKLNTASAGVTKDGLIVVDNTSLAWTINPEGVVYHELGHLLLHREHNDTVFPPSSMLENPIPASIMHSSFNYAYSPSKRQYYIDELFTAHNK